MPDDDPTDGAIPDAKTADGPGSDGSAVDVDGVPRIAPRTKATLLWAVIGLLSFLVLIQGYELVAARRVSLVVKFGVAIAVAAATAAASRLTRRRVSAENESH